MSKDLTGKRIAIVATNGFEQSELLEPKKALEKAGATTHVVSPEKGTIKGWTKKNWGEEVPVDVVLSKADAKDYDALLLPGGLMSPDVLRRDQHALAFVRAFFAQAKPVAAICHGPWTLIDAGVVRGRKITSYHSIQTDLMNAGALWTDEEVVVDNGLVTSRKPADLPAFIDKFVEEIAEGRHEFQRAEI